MKKHRSAFVWSHMTGRRSVTVWLGALMIVPSVLSSQPKQVREVSTPVVIGAARNVIVSDPEALFAGLPVKVEKTNDGAFIILPTTFGAIRVGADGRVRRLMPIGSGPNEQRSSRAILSIGDSLFVFDPALGRRTTFVSGVPISATSWGLRSVISIARIPSGYMVNAVLRTPTSAGLPLHLVDSQGTVVRSFGEEASSADAASMRGVQRILTNGQTCPVYSAVFWRFSIECLTLDGEVRDALRSPPSWWLDAVPNSGEERLGKPAPAIVSIHEEPSGLLLVSVAIASREWRKAAVIATDETSGKRVLDFASSRTSMLFTADMRTQRISRPLAISGYVVGSAKGSVFVFREDAGSGEPILQELKIRVP